MTAIPNPSLRIFPFAPGLNLHVLLVNEEPWFVARDACKALDMDIEKGAGKWVIGLDSDEKQTLRISGVLGSRNPNTVCINESGLYSLILKSRKPEAKAFKKWVTSEVLPSIRKHGGYLAPAVAKEVTESPEAFMARAVLMANETITKLQAINRPSWRTTQLSITLGGRGQLTPPLGELPITAPSWRHTFSRG